jgi:Domain of unknown function (DUF4062)
VIPNVFVSSTIADLHHLRDAIRDLLSDIGLAPVMSEHSEVGYSPSSSAEQSCYATMQQCQLAIVIIGRRYGSRGLNGVSVTQNEFRTARTQGIPVVCLVEKEVLTFKQVFETNRGAAGLSFPGMDAATDSFAFVDEVAAAPTNNAILAFGTVADARKHVKKQLAHLFWELLTRRGDSLKAEVRDVLAEVKALRHSLAPKDAAQQVFVRATRFLLEDRASLYRSVLEHLFGSIEDAVPQAIEATTFRDLVKAATGRDIEPFPPGTRAAEAKRFVEEKKFLFCRFNFSGQDGAVDTFFGVKADRQVEADDRGLAALEASHEQLRKAIGERTPRVGPKRPGV